MIPALPRISRQKRRHQNLPPDSLKLTISENPLEIQEIIIREAIPIVRPIILKIVEKEMKPKLCFDRRCRRATRVVSFIIFPDALQETG